jgi:hypothetical protein
MGIRHLTTLEMEFLHAPSSFVPSLRKSLSGGCKKLVVICCARSVPRTRFVLGKPSGPSHGECQSTSRPRITTSPRLQSRVAGNARSAGVRRRPGPAARRARQNYLEWGLVPTLAWHLGLLPTAMPEMMHTAETAMGIGGFSMLPVYCVTLLLDFALTNPWMRGHFVLGCRAP